jgi:hypothetical protein
VEEKILQKFYKGSAYIFGNHVKNGYVLIIQKNCAGYGCNSIKRGSNLAMLKEIPKN